jgi:hypothetical protein
LRFSGLILENILMFFLGLIMQRNSQKRDKKIEGERRQEKSFFLSQLFRPKAFDIWTSPKKFFMLFLNPPC